MRRQIVFPICVFSLFPIMWTQAKAQQVTIGTPTIGINDGFFESFGFGFGFQHRTPNSILFFRNGGSATPPFGAFDPNSQSGFGVGGRNGNFSWSMNAFASQGASRSTVSTTPMLTLPNGGFGFINNSIQRPFVTGIVPVVSQQVRIRQFHAAAERAKVQREAKKRAEAEELARLRASSTKKRAQRKQLDPPLILGSHSTDNTK